MGKPTSRTSAIIAKLKINDYVERITAKSSSSSGYSERLRTNVADLELNVLEAFNQNPNMEQESKLGMQVLTDAAIQYDTDNSSDQSSDDELPKPDMDICKMLNERVENGFLSVPRDNHKAQRSAWKKGQAIPEFKFSVGVKYQPAFIQVLDIMEEDGELDLPETNSPSNRQ